MANPKEKLSDNLAGEFYVDSTCINCGTCRKFAPQTFSDNDSTSYVSTQPSSADTIFKAQQALIACPVSAIGATSLKVSSDVLNSFPVHIENGIFVNGFNAEASYGADSYFIKDDGGNWLIDSPRFTPIFVKEFEKLGGIKTIFLTHRDDVADADKYTKHFGAKRIIHQDDRSACKDSEVILDQEEVQFGDAKVIHVRLATPKTILIY